MKLISIFLSFDNFFINSIYVFIAYVFYAFQFIISTIYVKSLVQFVYRLRIYGQSGHVSDLSVGYVGHFMIYVCCWFIGRMWDGKLVSLKWFVDNFPPKIIRLERTFFWELLCKSNCWLGNFVIYDILSVFDWMFVF